MKRLLTWMALTLFAALALYGLALADDGLSGEVSGGTWTLKDNILTISGPADMSGWKLTYDIEGSEDITKVIFGPEVSFIDPQFCSWVAYPTSMEVDPDNPNYMSTDGVVYSKDGTVLVRYPAGKPDESFIVPAEVVTIGESSFTFVRNLRNLTLQEGVESIGVHAFNYCDMEEISLPVSLQTIGSGDFRTTESLTTVNYSGTMYQWSTITIENMNTALLRLYIHCVDGDKAPDPETGSIGPNLTYELDYLTGHLIITGSGSMYSNPFTDNTSIVNVSIDNGVTNISRLAFASCHNLVSIEIPDSVTEIAYCAFGNCENLTDITIPASVTVFGDEVFDGCTSLAEIVFQGTIEEWQALVANTNNSKLDECEIICTDGSLAPEGNSGTCGENLTWTLDDNGLLTISGEGAMYNFVSDFSGSSSSPWFNKVSDILNISIGNGVTSIGNYAFHGCAAVKQVTIPQSVTNIGYDSFWNCTGLKTVKIQGSALGTIGGYAFSGCEGLTSINIPASVNRIGMGAFMLCTNLTAVTIPDGITSINDEVFYSCSSLKSITIPDSVTSIGSAAFYSCNSLTTIRIPDSVTSIRELAFADCTSLKSISVGTNNASYSSVGGVLFDKAQTTLIAYPAKKTGSYTVPDSVTCIASYAFSSCASLTGITIPDSVTSIGANAFFGCSNLNSIEIPDGVTSIGDTSFAFTALTTVTVPVKVTSIGFGAFYGCTSLASVALPVSIESIDPRAFYDCRNLENVYYSGKEEQWAEISIGSGNDALNSASIHFSTYPYIPDLILPSSLTAIESEAFAGLPDGTVVRIPASVTSIANDAFDDGTILIVPSGSSWLEWAEDKDYTVVQE